MPLLLMDGFDHYSYYPEHVFNDQDEYVLAYDALTELYSNSNDERMITTDVKNEIMDGTYRSLENAGFIIDNYGSDYSNRRCLTVLSKGRKNQGKSLGIYSPYTYTEQMPRIATKPLVWNNNILNIGFAMAGILKDYSMPVIHFKCSEGIIFELGVHGNDLVLDNYNNVIRAPLYATTRFNQFTDTDVDNGDGTTTRTINDGYLGSEYTGFVPDIWNWFEIQLDLTSNEIRVMVNSDSSDIIRIGLNSISQTSIKNSFQVVFGGSPIRGIDGSDLDGKANNSVPQKITRSPEYDGTDDYIYRYRRSYSTSFWYDDFYVADITDSVNSYGNIQIITRVPTEDSDTNFLNGTIDDPNTGYVDEMYPDYDGSFVYGSEVGTTDLFKSSVPIDGNNILAVGVITSGRRDGETRKGFTPMIRIDGTEELGDEIEVDLLSYTTSNHIFELNPSTGEKWTSDDVLNTEFGYRLSK